MDKQKLNTLASMAQQGCLTSEAEIYRRYLPVINRASQQIRHLIDDEVAFEADCIKRVQRAITKFDPTKDSFPGIVSCAINQAKAHFLTRRRKRTKLSESFERLTRKEFDNAEKRAPIEFSDDLAVVDDALLVKEKIALLAKGDLKKRAILIAWSDGFYNDSALSELLAQLFGGKSESHRQAIKRFRSFCQESLAKIA